MVAALTIGGAFLLGMVIAAGYAVRVLPAGARVPVNPGMPEYSVWLSRRAGLASWLGIGTAVYAVLAALTVSDVADNWSPSVRVVLLPSIMMVILAAEAGAVILARRTAAETPVAETLAPAASADSEPSGEDSAETDAADPGADGLTRTASDASQVQG